MLVASGGLVYGHGDRTTTMLFSARRIPSPRNHSNLTAYFLRLAPEAAL